MNTSKPAVPSRSQVLRHYAEDTTVHGLKLLIFARTKRTRLLWTLVLGTCFGFTCYGLHRLVISYTDNPTVTQISHFRSSSLPYPLIRFCPRNWVNESRALHQLNMTYDALFFALSMLGDVNLTNAHDGLVENVSEAEQQLRSWMQRENISDFLDVYAPLADDPNSTISCAKCLTQPPDRVITSQGVCYDLIYDGSQVTEQLFSGYVNPNFTYTPPNDSWTDEFVAQYATTYTTDLLYVGESETDFFGFDPIALNPNATYHILINPTLQRRISKPELKHSGYVCLTEYEFKFTKRKTEKMCKSHCEESVYGDHCRGYNFLGYISAKRKNPAIPFFTSLNYTAQQKDREAECEKQYEVPFMDCIRTCHSPCEQWVYETQVKQTTDDALTTDGIHVEFTYNYRLGEGVQLIEELSTRSAHTVMSEFGGQIGLWTGASALTLCQLVHFVIKWIWSPWGIGTGPNQHGGHHQQ